MNNVLSNMGLLALFTSLALLLTSNKVTYEVTGALVNEDGAPIVQHRVLLYNDIDELISVDTTDAEGKFTLAYQVTATSINPGINPDVPREFKLGSSYPNPFNPKTTIPFQAPRDANVTISLYNILGQEIMQSNRDVARGTHEILVNLGGRLSQGQYILRVQGEGFMLTEKITYVSVGISSGSPSIDIRAGGQIQNSISMKQVPADEDIMYRLVVEESEKYAHKEISIQGNQNLSIGTTTVDYKQELYIEIYPSGAAFSIPAGTEHSLSRKVQINYDNKEILGYLSVDSIIYTPATFDWATAIFDGSSETPMIEVTAKATSLEPGTHTAEVWISASEAVGKMAVFTIALEIENALSVNATSIKNALDNYIRIQPMSKLLRKLLKN